MITLIDKTKPYSKDFIKTDDETGQIIFKSELYSGYVEASFFPDEDEDYRFIAEFSITTDGLTVTLVSEPEFQIEAESYIDEMNDLYEESIREMRDEEAAAEMTDRNHAKFMARYPLN